MKELSKLKQDVKEEDIERIATISSLDPEIAKLISDTIKEVGVNGIITVEKGSKIGYTKEIVKGARFNKGLISQYFINDFENERTVLENPYIVLIDRKVSLGEQIKNLMESIAKTGNKSILFIADDIDGIALASLIQSNKTVQTMTQSGQTKQGTYDIACVRNPYNATPAKDFLLDIASLTGAQVISEEAGIRLDQADVSFCGQAEKVIVTKDKCTIIGGKGGEILLDRIKGIEKEIEETTSDYQKIMLKDRLASLTGGIGVIRVGTYTDTEFNAKKYKFDNAINATQAALQEGILPGGGIALWEVAEKIKESLFKNPLRAPFHQMVDNAGVGKVNDVVIPDGNGIGIDFKSKQKVNMFDAGIIDPFKVVRIALESATAIAMSLVSTEVVIVNEDEKTKE